MAKKSKASDGYKVESKEPAAFEKSEQASAKKSAPKRASRKRLPHASRMIP